MWHTDIYMRGTGFLVSKYRKCKEFRNRQRQCGTKEMAEHLKLAQCFFLHSLLLPIPNVRHGSQINVSFCSLIKKLVGCLEWKKQTLEESKHTNGLLNIRHKLTCHRHTNHKSQGGSIKGPSGHNSLTNIVSIQTHDKSIRSEEGSVASSQGERQKQSDDDEFGYILSSRRMCQKEFACLLAPWHIEELLTDQGKRPASWEVREQR